MGGVVGNGTVLATWRRSCGEDRACERSGCGQAPTIPAVVDLCVRLVVDHDRLRGQGGAACEPCDMARMSCPRRSKRSAVRTMSSCCGVPTRWAIKPMRTAGCAVKRFCGGERMKMPVLSTEPIACAVKTSLCASRGVAGTSLEHTSPPARGASSPKGLPLPALECRAERAASSHRSQLLNSAPR